MNKQNRILQIHSKLLKFLMSPDILKRFLSMFSNHFYIIDFERQNFLFTANDELFLCGHSCEEAMKLGYNFYPLIVHPADIKLLTDMYYAVSCDL